MSIVIPKFSPKKFTASVIDRKAFLLQHLGPPAPATEPRLLEVIALLNFHSYLDSGVAPVIKLIKTPVPTPAAQAP